MRRLAQRAYFEVCLALGRLLRSARYSDVRIESGQRTVRKQRAFYAPLLIGLSDPLVRILDTGMRVLPQREWEERERTMHQSLRGTSVRIDNGALILAQLPGETLARLLEKSEPPAPHRAKAIELAVVALAELHARGLTHGDAMAENVMVDLSGEVAHWFDFETLHDGARPVVWRRADDVRALLATCLARTRREGFAETVHLIRDVYADQDVTRLVARSFASVMRRPLMFHLGQASLPFEDFQIIARLLSS
jgi:hypothetical protein